MELTFWDLYFPVFAAMVSATLLFEAIHFFLNLLVAKRQLKRIQDHARLLLENGGNPGQLSYQFNGLDLMAPPYGSYVPPQPTASGSIERKSNGFYL
jgi:hypothetical protein